MKGIKQTCTFARLDFARRMRTGFGETVFGPGKTPSQLAEIFAAFAKRRLPVLATRVTPEQADAVSAAGVKATYHSLGGLLACSHGVRPRLRGKVAVLTGGTAARYFDVGVAGLHRLLGVIDEVRKADVVVAVAGMEGALPSVVSGLVPSPVIAVPTSVGYGAGAGGVAAALAMLNSCAEGVSVVNIDNGFGAAVVACRMLRRMKGAK